MVLRRLPCKFCKVCEKTSKVINEISVKFDRVFQKLFIYTSIQTSILNRLLYNFAGGGPRVVVSTAAFHARVRGSVPGLGGLKETKNISSPSTCESQYCGEPP